MLMRPNKNMKDQVLNHLNNLHLEDWDKVDHLSILLCVLRVALCNLMIYWIVLKKWKNLNNQTFNLIVKYKILLY